MVYEPLFKKELIIDLKSEFIFFSEKPSPQLSPQTTTYPQAKLLTRYMGVDHVEAPPTPGATDTGPPLATHMDQRKQTINTVYVACRPDVSAVHLLEPPLRRPRSRTRVTTQHRHEQTTETCMRNWCQETNSWTVR
jgi:hypothetical protein